MKKIFILFFCLMLFGCAEKIVYVNQYVRPEIPRLEILARPNISKTNFDIVRQNELQLYCTNAEGIDTIRKNQWGLQDSIKSYEKMINAYEEFYDDYERKRNLPKPTE